MLQRFGVPKLIKVFPKQFAVPYGAVGDPSPLPSPTRGEGAVASLSSVILEGTVE
jgi:hypothetical protein